MQHLPRIFRPNRLGRVAHVPILSVVEENRQTVLVIDDDADFGELIALVIEGAGCRAVVAHDGLYGLGLASEISPALILCDYSMPGLTGEDVLCALQADPAMADVPRVLMSGLGGVWKKKKNS